MRRTIADDMSLQVQAAVEDAKDEVQSAIKDEIRSAARRAPPSPASVLCSFLKALIVMAFVYLIVLKATSNTQRRAAVAVQSASETAERESLKRQVSEAKMQMMQAQVEPHFLFNTLASIDHLIETDPPRASTMQKNLIAYLRAALPQMRENATDLGREVDLVARLSRDPEGADGGAAAGVVRRAERAAVGRLPADDAAVAGRERDQARPRAEARRRPPRHVGRDRPRRPRRVVADTGLGFSPGGAPTSGTGLGLTNIRERLKLLYGDRARLVIEANQVERRDAERHARLDRSALPVPRHEGV